MHIAVARLVDDDIDKLLGGVFQLHKVRLADGRAAVQHQHDAHHLLLRESRLGVLHLAVHLPTAAVVLPAVELHAAVEALRMGRGGVVEHQLHTLVGVVAVDGVVVRKADALAADVIQFPGLAAFSGRGQLTLDIEFCLVGLCIGRKCKQQRGCKQSKMFLHLCLLVIKCYTKTCFPIFYCNNGEINPKHAVPNSAFRRFST